MATAAGAAENSARDQAAALLASGRSADAVAAAETALREDERVHGAEDPETARSLHVLIECYNAAGQYARAEPLAERAVRIRQALTRSGSLETAESLHDLSETYAGEGNFAKALPPAQQALAERERLAGRESLATAESLNDLGVLYLRMGDVGQGASYIDRGRRIREQLRPHESAEVAESLSNAAAVAWQQRDRQQARQLYEEALAIKSSPSVYGPTHPKVAGAHVGLASVYVDLWRNTSDQAERSSFALQAREHASAARRILAANPASPDTAGALTTLAWSLLAFAPVTNDETRDLLQQAVAVQEALVGARHPNTIRARISLAVFEEAIGDPKRALALFEQALPSEDEWLAEVMPVGNDPLSLRLAEQFDSDFQAALSLVNQHFATDQSAVRFGLASVLRRKGLVLDVASRTEEKYAKSLNGEGLASWRSLNELRNQLSATLISGNSGPSYTAELERLGSAIAAEEERLRALSIPIAEELAQRSATVDAVAHRLPRNAVLVEFVEIRDWDARRMAWSQTSRYLAFALTGDGRVTLVDLGDASAIDQDITAALKAVRDPDAYDHPQAYEEKADAALSRLYQAVLMPLEHRGLLRERVIISPDGEMSRIPFEALRPAGGKFLIEDHVISQVTSGRDLVRGKSKMSPSIELFLVANPNFADTAVADATRGRGAPGSFRHDFGPLPGTAQEAEAIEPLITGTKTVLTGGAATEAAVRAAHAPRVLHLATHGFFLENKERKPADPLARSGDRSGLDSVNPLARSGMAFAGANFAYIDQCGEGILCGSEVEQMNLYGTELVVLSACETALGDIHIGEGVYGLRRAFVLAGARSLIMSLWPVDDAVTRDLMSRFYRAYRAGASPALALHGAQLEIIASLRQPGGSTAGVPVVSLWAPFIVQETGDE